MKGYSKECAECFKSYLGGEGLTKIYFPDKNEYIDYPDDKGISFEGIEKYEEESYFLLTFCSVNCFNSYILNSNSQINDKGDSSQT